MDNLTNPIQLPDFNETQDTETYVDSFTQNNDSSIPFECEPIIVDDTEQANLLLDQILTKAINIGASDIFINPQGPITYMVLSKICKDYSFGIPTPEFMIKLQDAIITYVEEDIFLTTLELDVSYTIRYGRHKDRRFRVSIGKTFKNTFMVFRTISDNIPTPQNLSIPLNILEWFERPNGLILINGPVGSGKSTTIASILNHKIGNTPKHVITIEKPIEYKFSNKGQALFTQREVEKDTLSFHAGLKSALRQAPDIIFVGEVRDKEEINTLLSASEVGRLAVSTIHASNCIKVISRILTLYPQQEHQKLLSSISEHTIGLVNQKLLLYKDGKKRIPIHEILHFTPQVKNYIAQNNMQALEQYMIDNKLTFEHKLVQVYLDGQITLQQAKQHANDLHLFNTLLEKQVQ